MGEKTKVDLIVEEAHADFAAWLERNDPNRELPIEAAAERYKSEAAMTEKLDLEAIEARHNEEAKGCITPHTTTHRDRAALIAEVRRLRAENTELQEFADVQMRGHKETFDELTAAKSQAVRAAYEDAAKIADMYSETNLQQAGDTILLDPCLQGGGFTPENVDKSVSLQLDGCIHSARHSAARDIATAFRARANGDKSP